MPDLICFPKFLWPHLDMEQLADMLLECGFDGVDIIIRDTAWCKEDDYPESLPVFCDTMRAKGLSAYAATTSWGHDSLEWIEDAYRLFADNGVTMYRFTMQGYRGPGTYREDSDRCRETLAKLEPLGQKHGVKALLQTHGGCLTWSPLSAYVLVQGLDPAAVGVHYDPGNMRHQEGWTDPHKSVDVLREYMGYVGVKSCGRFLVADPKDDQRLKWQRQWMRLSEGMVDWREILRELKAGGFDGPLGMHNFYENTLEGLVEGTKADVAYLRGLLGEVWGQS